MAICYLNYFVITPRLYLAGYVKKYWIVLCATLLLFTAFEFVFLIPEIKIVKPLYYYLSFTRYLVKSITLVFIRNGGIVLLFTLLKSNQYYISQYQVERKAVVEQTSHYNIVVSSKKIKTVRIQDIVYIQHQKNYTYFHLIDGSSYAQYISLLKVVEELPEGKFLQISRSTLVNTLFPMQLDNNTLTVETAEGKVVSLAVSPKYREELLQHRGNL